MTPQPITSIVVDTSTKLSASEARALYEAGVRAVGRYVFFGPPRPGDIDADELSLLIDAGLTVFLIQHVRNPGWTGSYAQGQDDARAAIANALRCGYGSGQGLGLALDLEGCKTGDPEQARGWCDTIWSAYRPLVYVGYASGMTTATLDSLAGDPHYWCDFAPLPERPAPSRGYDMHQQAQRTLAGVGVDEDTLLHPGTILGLGPNAPDPTPTPDPATGTAQDPAA